MTAVYVLDPTMGDDRALCERFDQRISLEDIGWFRENE